MSSKQDALRVKERIQLYIREMLADTLQAAGFTSYNGDEICWYRVMNQEVVHFIHFYTPWAWPAFLNVQCSVYPLYAAFNIPQRVIPRDRARWHEGMMLYRTFTDRNGECYMPDGLVLWLPMREKALEILNNAILPTFEGYDDGQSCYRLHKEWYFEMDKLDAKDGEIRYLSPHFCEEVIYMEDAELYPRCLVQHENMAEKCREDIARWQEAGIKIDDHVIKTTEKRIAWSNAFVEALTKDRQPYIDMLEKRKRGTIKKLQRGGIPV